MSVLGRRAFLKAGALALLGTGTVPPFLARAAQAAAAPARRVKTLIAVFQRGAADGLSMVVPYGDVSYYGARATIAIPRPGPPGADGAIDLDGFFGLHPACAPLLPAWQERRLAVVHACGSPHATRSHFDAQDYMETATPGVKSTADGWLSRALVATRPPAPSSFRGVAIGPVLPRSLRGAGAALAFPAVSDFEVGREGQQAASGMRRDFEALYERSPAGLGAAGREAFEAMRALRAAEPERQAPANGAVYPRGRLGESLRQLAQLIKMGVGLEVGFVDVGGWDTHAAQGAGTGQLAARLADLAQGLAAFDLDLGERMSDVLVLTMTEFGRTVRENGNRGTDHGHGTAMLALGGSVVGGRVLGRWPGLAREHLFEGRDLAVTTDFRHLFAEVADRHLGVSRGAGIFPGVNVDPASYPGVLM
jgi:uncharacterized protein (DUF1501 family)